MTNTEKLKEKINKTGYKIGHLCKLLGLSRGGFWKKINNHSEFNASEIKKIADILKLSEEEKNNIFFN